MTFCLIARAVVCATIRFMISMLNAFLWLKKRSLEKENVVYGLDNALHLVNTVNVFQLIHNLLRFVSVVHT